LSKYRFTPITKRATLQLREQQALCLWWRYWNLFNMKIGGIQKDKNCN